MELDTSFSKDKLSLCRQIHLFQGGAHVLEGHMFLSMQWHHAGYQVTPHHNQ